MLVRPDGFAPYGVPRKKHLPTGHQACVYLDVMKRHRFRRFGLTGEQIASSPCDSSGSSAESKCNRDIF